MLKTPIIRISQSTLKVGFVCGGCHKSAISPVITTELSCYHCKKSSLTNVTGLPDYARIVTRTPIYLVLKYFEIHDEVILHANENHVSSLRAVCDTFMKAFACEIKDDGMVETKNDRTGEHLLVQQVRIIKNPWIVRVMTKNVR